MFDAGAVLDDEAVLLQYQGFSCELPCKALGAHGVYQDWWSVTTLKGLPPIRWFRNIVATQTATSISLLTCCSCPRAC